MGHKQYQILKFLSDGENNWRDVVQWISRRFDEEELRPSMVFVMSEPVSLAFMRMENTTPVHEQVRASWRELEKRWIDGWEMEYNGNLPDAESYFDSLMVDTNDWFNRMFPSGKWSAIRKGALIGDQKC